jgi:hypothetical protein
MGFKTFSLAKATIVGIETALISHTSVSENYAPQNQNLQLKERYNGFRLELTNSRDFMETGKKTASSLEDWLEIMKKAHTNEEYRAALHSLPDRQTQDLWLEETESQLSSIMELMMLSKKDLT